MAGTPRSPPPLLASASKKFLREGTFRVPEHVFAVQEDVGIVRIKVTRDQELAVPATITFSTSEGSAKAGRHFKAVEAGVIRFASHERQKEARVLVHDDPHAMEDTREFYVHIEFPNATVETVTVRILKDDVNVPQLVLNNGVFQATSATATLYTLFGLDMVQLYGGDQDDINAGYVTMFCILLFTVEITLTVCVKGVGFMKYAMFWMDVIATVALVGSLPQFAGTIVGVILTGGGSANIARAARAARAGARSGRIIKLPKLLAIMAEVGATFTLKRQQKRKLKRLELQGRDEEAENMRKEAEAGGSPLSPAKIGARMVELVTGKVVVMLMLILVINALLSAEPIAQQQEQGLQHVKAAYNASGGDFEDPGFKMALWVYTRGSEGKPGSHFNEDQELVYLAVNGQVVPRLVHTDDPSPENLVYEEGAFYNNSDVYDSRRDIELLPSGDCGLDPDNYVRLTGSDPCEDAALFDNKKTIDWAATANMLLTVAVVFDMGLGMGLIGKEMQSTLVTPLDRLSNLFKAFKNIFMTALDKPPDRIRGPLPKGFPASAKEQNNKRFKEFKAKKEEKKKGVETPELTISEKVTRTHAALVEALRFAREIFPPDQPLALLLNTVEDIEMSFDANLNSVRRKVEAAQDNIMLLMSHYQDVRELWNLGVLTQDQLEQRLDELLSDSMKKNFFKLCEHKSLQKPPLSIAVQLGPAAKRYVEKRARATGLMCPPDEPVGELPDELTNGVVREVLLRETRTVLRVVLAYLGEEVPPGMQTWQFNQLSNSMLEVLKRRLGVAREVLQNGDEGSPVTPVTSPGSGPPPQDAPMLVDSDEVVVVDHD